MHKYEMLVLPVSYFGPVGIYAAILRNEKVLIEAHENFTKQTIRSRCEIYGANGKQMLSVPVEKRGNHIKVKDVRISYNEDWQKIHWRSIVSAYRNSAYFEYYADDIEPFFRKKTIYIFDLDMDLIDLLTKLLKMQINFEFTKDYTANYGPGVFDLRNEYGVLPEIPEYYQVFKERHGFIPHLSILDLLFNCGPDSIKILSGK